MKTSHVILGVAVVVAAVAVYRAVKRRGGVPASTSALDPNAWAPEFGAAGESQWVFDTYVRQAAAR